MEEEYKLFCCYCLSPINDEERYCRVCGGDRSSDPGVEMPEADYLEQPRKPCQYCGIPVITYATICFSCKKELKDD
jgi:hypothetical protein